MTVGKRFWDSLGQPKEDSLDFFGDTILELFFVGFSWANICFLLGKTGQLPKCSKKARPRAAGGLEFGAVVRAGGGFWAPMNKNNSNGL